MPSLQCPKCKQPIQIANASTSSRVRCSHCQAEFTIKGTPQKQASPGAVGAAKPTAQPVRATVVPTASGALQTNDPFAAIDLNALGQRKRVDLGVAPIAAGVLASPTGDQAPWLPGNAPVYVPLTEEEAAAQLASAGKPTSSKKKVGTPSKTNYNKIIAIASTLLFMFGSTVVAALFVNLRERNQGEPVAARPQFKVPDGFEIIKIKGVETVFPIIADKKQKSPSGDGKITRSDKTGNYYVFFVTDKVAGDKEIDEVRAGKVARNILHGDILPGGETKILGHKAFVGSYSAGVFLPDRTQIEMIPLEDRFIIRGYVKPSELQTGFNPDRTFDREAEDAEVAMFRESLYIGKKPGFFGG